MWATFARIDQLKLIPPTGMCINIYSLFLLPPNVRGIRVSSKSGIQTGVNSYLILFFFIYSSNFEVSIPIFLTSAKSVFTSNVLVCSNLVFTTDYYSIFYR